MCHEYDPHIPIQRSQGLGVQEGDVDCPTYIPSINLHEKRDTQQIKVKLPNGTNFQMSAFGQGNNEDSLVHLITVKHLLEQKGTLQDTGKVFQAILEVRKHLKPLLKGP